MKLNQLLKKKFIALLLFICCLLTAWALLTASTVSEKKLKDLAQIDSLIVDSLNESGFTRKEIDQYKIKVDSTFHRKVFSITVLKSFPETKLHLALKQTFKPYNIGLPARVLFPDKDLYIYVSFKGTILRTLIVDTKELDKSLSSLMSVTPGIFTKPNYAGII